MVAFGAPNNQIDADMCHHPPTRPFSVHLHIAADIFNSIQVFVKEPLGKPFIGYGNLDNGGRKCQFIALETSTMVVENANS
jgi:hypothetical protein